MAWILRLLRSLGCNVTFFAVTEQEAGHYESDLAIEGIEVVRGGDSFHVFAQARANLYDTVVLSRPAVAAALLREVRRNFPTATVIYDTVDLHFVREARSLPYIGSRGLWGRLRSIKRRHAELSCIRQSHVTVAVTEAEAAIIRRWVPNAVTAVIPTVHVLDPGPAVPFEGRAGLLFIGAFRHPPNVDAVLFFVNDVFPLVVGEIDVGLMVLGSHPPDSVLRLASPQIEVAGYVPDVSPYFRRARVFVSPLRYGAGMKGKNGQAMAFGLPLVTTSVGAEGMDLVDGTHALVRDDPAAFAAAVVELYKRRELWETISCNSRAVVEERWGPEPVRQRLARLLTVDSHQPEPKKPTAERGVGTPVG